MNSKKPNEIEERKLKFVIAYMTMVVLVLFGAMQP